MKSSTQDKEKGKIHKVKDDLPNDHILMSGKEKVKMKRCLQPSRKGRSDQEGLWEDISINKLSIVVLYDFFIDLFSPFIFFSTWYTIFFSLVKGFG